MIDKGKPISCGIILINNSLKSHFVGCNIYFFLKILIFTLMKLLSISLFLNICQLKRNENICILRDQWLFIIYHLLNLINCFNNKKFYSHRRILYLFNGLCKRICSRNNRFLGFVLKKENDAFLRYMIFNQFHICDLFGVQL